MSVHNLSIFFDATSTTCPPPDVTFIVKTKEGIIAEVKAHKLILAFASDVFNREFYGSMTSEDVIEIKDSTQEVFQLFMEFIYNKQLLWKDYDLRTLASLYYLGEKYNVKVLRDQIIISVPDHQVNRGNVLEIATLAEEVIHHDQLSQVLYQTAAVFLKGEFGSESRRVFDYCAELNVNETQAFVIFKMMSMMSGMKTVKDLNCENCKMPNNQCHNGKGITSMNFVPGARVLPTQKANIGLEERVKRLVRIQGTGFTGCKEDGTEVEGLALKPDYYTYNCL